MSVYQFAIITSPEAGGYDASRDDLQFTGISGASATNITVTDGTIRINSTGASVTLGPRAAGEVLSLPDGSRLVLSADGAGTLSGTALGDHLYGGRDDDLLRGEAGDDILEGGDRNDLLGARDRDTLVGGAGRDSLAGGADADTFVFAPGDSGVAEGRLDAVTDWEGGLERLQFSTPITGGDYVELTAASYSAALQAANQQIATGAMDVVAVKVGADVIVFADTRGDNGGADDAIVLAGRTLDNIAAANILGFTPGGAPPPAPGGAPPVGSAGTLTFETMTAAQALGYSSAANDLRFSNPNESATSCLLGFNPDGTITFATNNKVLAFGAGLLGEAGIVFADGSRMGVGGAGDDVLIAFGGNDYLGGGPGNDTLNGGPGQDRLSGGPGSDLFVVLPADNGTDLIVDWEPVDRLAFGGVAGDASNFMVLAATSNLDQATAAATGAITTNQAEYVACQVGDRVFVWADIADRDVVGGRVALNAASIANFSASNIVARPNISALPLPPAIPGGTPSAPPPPVFLGLSSVSANIRGNMDTAVIPDVPGQVLSATSRSISISGSGVTFDIFGRNLAYDADGDLAGGEIRGFLLNIFSPPPAFRFEFSIDTTAPRPVSVIDGDTLQGLFPGIFSADDRISGSGDTADLLRGYDGSDILTGNGGGDTIFGGTGDDIIFAEIAPTGRIGLVSAGSTYLRGDEGNDHILGGSGFDDANGNMGNDTISTGAGDDYSVGGKDDDLLFGDAGADIVYGNLGNDTCEGGDGNDIVRGGQGDDVVSGGAGGDFVSGDRGSDTMTGGAGADLFHTFGDAGLDRVTDFSLAQGDRVMLDPGTVFTVSQVGADTVIDMTGGGQMVLVGVAMSTLTPGWIFGA